MTTHNLTASLAVPGAKILVIRFRWIGDVLLSSVLCNSLKQTFPNAVVDYLIQDASADLYQDHPYIDNVIGITQQERNSPLKYWRKIRAVASCKYDLIIDAQGTAQSELLALMSRKTAISIGRKRRRRGLFYSYRVDAPPSYGHKIEERLKLLEPLIELGIEVKRDENIVVNVPSVLKAQLRRSMVKRGIDFARPVFVFSVSAKHGYKKWRVDYLQKVAQYCLENYHAQIVLYSGSAAEAADIAEFHKAMNMNPDIYADIKTDNLMMLAALIQNCQLFIGNEGGPRHIAQSVNVPSAAVFSPSAKKPEWLPSRTRYHQGLEWDDMTTMTDQEKGALERDMQTGDKRYWELYNSITPQAMISLLNDVAAFAGITKTLS